MLGPENQSLLDRKVSRSGILKTVVKSGEAFLVMGTLHALRQGITLDPLSESYAEVNPEDIEALSTFRPITIAHRAGNNPESLRRAARAGMTHVDIDAVKTGGKLYADHTAYEDIGHIVIGGFDLNTWRFQIGPPHFELKQALEVAATEGVGVSIELKRGDFNPRDVEKVFSWADDLQIQAMVNSVSFERADMVRKTIRDPNKVVYIPQNKEEWMRIFIEQERERRNSILTNAGSVMWQLDLLKDYEMTVYVGKINSTSTVRELKAEGVRGFMNGRRVLEKLFPKTRETQAA